ncbi:MAG: hypothetical protein A2Y82_05545 [Candidatus Buchananbacteria bacterium RBG_13_36_9]|uniref:Zinc-finger domain-containing protein n=1 Tax=Candidatus Buchananbacteria bacterium RBG_13_36_9 TaxID=1797530 RepID=A0A1G1XRC0_9BACT|nr:MAG: hypothetical protein A2Y82_05545 [Candidatus Buchananbacteria bacterium RBG_13_36_9]
MSCLTINEILNHLGDENGDFSDADKQAIINHSEICAECKSSIDKGEKICQKAGLRLFDLIFKRSFALQFFEQGPEKFLLDLEEIPPEFAMDEDELKKNLGEEFQDLSEEYFQTLHDKIMKGINEIRKKRLSSN